MQLAIMMNTQRILHALLVIAAVGVPGFLKFDTTGLTHDYGLINAQSLSRIASSLTIGYLFALFLLLSTIQQTKYGIAKSFSFDLGGFRLIFLFYGLLLLSLVNAGGTTEFLLALYRMCEWMLAVGLCSVALGTLGSKRREKQSASDTFFCLLKYITTIPIVIVFVGMFIVPDLAMFRSNGVIRLGGYLYHPNAFGVLAGIGAVVFWCHSPDLKNRLWAGVLIGAMVLTYSRGAMIGFLVSIAFVFFTHRKAQIRISVWVAALALFFFVLAFSTLSYDEIDPILMRGGNVEQLATLNNRTHVWTGSWRAILDSPLVGHGFIFGPKDLGTYADQHWWHAPHAHNDFLNAGVAGGIGAAILTVMIYIHVGYAVLTIDRPSAEKAAIIAIYVQLTVYAMLTPLLSSAVFYLGIIMLLLMRYLAVTAPQRARIGAVHGRSRNARGNIGRDA